MTDVPATALDPFSHPLLATVSFLEETASNLIQRRNLKKAYLFNNLLHQISIFIFIFYQKHWPHNTSKSQLELFRYQETQGFYSCGMLW